MVGRANKLEDFHSKIKRSNSLTQIKNDNANEILYYIMLLKRSNSFSYITKLAH